MEVKDWTLSTAEITLFLAVPFNVQAGDMGAIYPGCDKRLTTCINKFIITGSQDFDAGNINNFRGEPYVPGQDEFFNYPDSR